MKTRRAHSWQLILADLSLILFLVTLTALASEERNDPLLAKPAQPTRFPTIAPASAVFRPDPLGPPISDWLSEQAPDPRLMLTIFASHTGSDPEATWEAAQALARDARGRGFKVRVLITQSDASDIYARLAYDGETATQ